jgi:hypothetical protein
VVREGGKGEEKKKRGQDRRRENRTTKESN